MEANQLPADEEAPAGTEDIFTPTSTGFTCRQKSSIQPLPN